MKKLLFCIYSVFILIYSATTYAERIKEPYLTDDQWIIYNPEYQGNAIPIQVYYDETQKKLIGVSRRVKKMYINAPVVELK